MSTVWIVSFALAWAVIALLVVCVVALLRQVGELRAGTGGAVAAAPSGAALYDPVAATPLTVLHDGGAPLSAPLTLGGDQERPMLLVVHAPGCASCEGIEEALEDLAREQPEAQLVSVLGLSDDAARQHLKGRPLAGVPTVAFSALPPALRPELTPALVGVAREGAVAALGSPSSLADLREAAAVAAGAVLIAGPDSIRYADWGRAVPAWGVSDPVEEADLDHADAGPRPFADAQPAGDTRPFDVVHVSPVEPEGH